MPFVKRAFEYGLCGHTVQIAAGAKCDWHKANQKYYVSPDEFTGITKHDATYYGIPVDSDNVCATRPKPIYDATISYYTPAGRKVLFGKLIAADTLTDCRERLLGELNNAEKFGRRRIGRICDDFSATFVTMQIGSN